MRNKAFHSYKHGCHSFGTMRAWREFEDEPQNERLKTDRRVVARYIDPWIWEPAPQRKYRSWKAHSKCRRQWEKHAVPLDFAYCIGDYRAIVRDHNRKWIVERLKEKKTCIFNIHHDENMMDLLYELSGEGVCTDPEFVANGMYEVTLLKHEPGVPHEKTSRGDKGIASKYARRHERRERQKVRREAMEAVAERTRRASRRSADGLAKPPLPAELFVSLNPHPAKPQKFTHTVAPLSAFDRLLKDAKEDHIKGCSRRNRACINLLQNYSHYQDAAKSRIGLAPYEHDYHGYQNTLEQCCVWLTGRTPNEFPPWVFAFLTNAQQQPPFARSVLSWAIGRSSVRDSYGLSRNEVHEILHLPETIENEAQAIVASIALARHCDIALTDELVKQVPTFCVIFENGKRETIRGLCEWLGSLAAPPTAEQLHDILDYLFRGGVGDDPLFSFKGRTLHSMECHIRQWHCELQQLHELEVEIARERRRQMEDANRREAAFNIGVHRRAGRHTVASPLMQALLSTSWRRRDYDYVHKNSYIFQEITNGKALMDEGNAQHNCVFSYRQACLSGNTSIVSIRGVSTKEHLTIEINNSTRKIVQIREVCNKLPSKDEMRVVRIFASAKNLSISC